MKMIPNINQNYLDKLDFEFNCTEFNETEIKLQLLSKHPNHISMFGPDIITVEFYENQFFKTNSSGQLIQKKFTVFKELPK